MRADFGANANQHSSCSTAKGYEDETNAMLEYLVAPSLLWISDDVLDVRNDLTSRRGETRSLWLFEAREGWGQISLQGSSRTALHGSEYLLIPGTILGMVPVEYP